MDVMENEWNEEIYGLVMTIHIVFYIGQFFIYICPMALWLYSMTSVKSKRLVPMEIPNGLIRCLIISVEKIPFCASGMLCQKEKDAFIRFSSHSRVGQV